MNDFFLKCILCGEEIAAKPDATVCGRCGGNTEVKFDLPAPPPRPDLRQGPPGLERFLDLLPLRSAASLPPLPVGPTPLIPRPDLAREYGVSRLEFKDDGRLPSASFKDRASAVALARAIEIEAEEICTASTGNAAAALACLAAASGRRPYIFVPRSAPEGKIAQLVTFGARIFLVDGNYDSACDLSLAATRKFGWYNRNTGFNPYTREGKKTAAFEILLQRNWRVPDVVVVPVGDGNIISGIHKGFSEAKSLGWTDRVPRLIAAQSEKSDAVSRAVRGDGTIHPVHATTIADSISVDRPRDGEAAVRAVRESNGSACTVSDEAILAAQRELASRTGIFAEPAASCAFAVFRRAVRDGTIRPDEEVVVLVTGNGLKDIAAVTRNLGRLPVVEPDISSLEKILSTKPFGE
ncbi:MAG: threonine synthase [Candidatus Hydrogenedentota bacterium]|nr:MAG: threonine synthase [Candidatus Hydrogenedentota bacterium]